MSEVSMSNRSLSDPPLSDTAAPAEIFEQGYRAYAGERAGLRGSMVSIWRASLQRGLGLRRKFRFKVVPLITIVLAYLPALAFIGIAILFPAEIAEELVDYPGYYGFITTAMILLTAFVVPELLSADRQSGMLGLYLAGPITRASYLASKAAAMLTILAFVTFLPLVFVLIGYSITGLGPDSIGEVLKLLGRMAVSGVVFALFFSLVGMAVSSLTDRKGFASAAIIMLFIGSGILGGILTEAADVPDWVQLFALVALPIDLVTRVYGDPITDDNGLVGIETWQSLGTYVLVCAISIAVITWGYRRLEVTK